MVKHLSVKRSIGLLFLIVTAMALLVSNPASAISLNLNAPAEVYFSPNGGATDAVVREIGNAQQELLVQAYSFTSKPIASALVQAAKRGVNVQIILDKSQETEKYSAADFTAHMGIPTYIDAAHKIAHNKIIIVDRGVVITGSFNFTRAAEFDNAENLLIIRSPEMARIYIANWIEHQQHSQRMTGR